MEWWKKFSFQKDEADIGTKKDMYVKTLLVVFGVVWLGAYVNKLYFFGG